MAIIKPYSATSQGRMLKWFDSFVKKTIYIFAVVFFYENPILASTVMGSMGCLDMFITARDLTGIMILNVLIFCESLGFTLAFFGPIIFNMESLTKETREKLGQYYVYV